MDTELANATIGASLRALRAKHNLSREKLFEMTGIPVITLRRIEDGKRAAPATTLIVICRALGEEVGEFLDYVQRETEKAGGFDAGE